MKRTSWHVKYFGNKYTDFEMLLYYLECNNITTINSAIFEQIMRANLFNGRHDSIPAIDKIFSKLKNVATLKVYNKDMSCHWWKTYKMMYTTLVYYNIEVIPVDINKMSSSDISVSIGHSRSTNTPAKTQRLCTTSHTITFNNTWNHNRRVLKSQNLSTVIEWIRLYCIESQQLFTSNANTIRRYLNGGSGYEQGPPMWFQRFAQWVTS